MGWKWLGIGLAKKVLDVCEQRMFFGVCQMSRSKFYDIKHLHFLLSDFFLEWFLKTYSYSLRLIHPVFQKKSAHSKLHWQMNQRINKY